jgi:hypothetical protein
MLVFTGLFSTSKLLRNTPVFCLALTDKTATIMKTLLTLPPKKLYLLTRVAALLLGLNIRLKRSPAKTTQRWLSRISSRGHGQEANYLNVKRDIVWAIDALSPYFAATCLPRALAAQTLLLQAGYETTLRIGMAKTADGKLEGHAWLERNGDIIIGELDDLARFTLVPALEDAWRIFT